MMKRTVGRHFLGFALIALVALISCVIVSDASWASEPTPWQIGMQPPVTPVAVRLQALHTELLWIIIPITLFVLALLIYVCVKFRASVHPVPSRTSHNTIIEILWTVLPILILLVISVPSLKLLYFQERTPPSALTLKVTGLQWYWHYAYPDNGNFAFDSYGIDPKDLKPGDKRLLDVDNEVVLPVNTNVRIQIAGADVMHSWFIPSFAVQKYSVVGRLNEVWINVDKEGVYYGECNQICGVNHAFMPIKVRIVSQEEFAKWTETAKQKFAQNGTAPAVTQVAAVTQTTGAETTP